MDRGLGCFMRKIKANFVRNIFILLVHAVFLADIFARDVTEKKVEKMDSWQERFDINDKKGKYNVLVTATDLGGNKTVSGPFNIFIDPKSDLPVCRITNPVEMMRVPGNLNIVGTCVDDDSVQYVELILDGDSEHPVRAVGKEFWSYFLNTESLKEGLHTVEVYGVDVNGLKGESVKTQWCLDRQQPVTEVTNIGIGTIVSGNVTLSGIISDGNGIKSMSYSLDNGEHFTNVKVSNNKKTNTANFKFSIDTKKLQEGAAVIWFEATDLQDSVGYYSFLCFIDNTKPEVNIVWPQEKQIENGVFTAAGSAKDAIGIKSLTWEFGGEKGEFEIIPGNPYWTKEFASDKGLKSGKLVITATDTAGNVTKKERQITINPELDKPVVEVEFPPPGAQLKENEFFIRGIAKDDDAVESVAVFIDGIEVAKIETHGVFYVPIEDEKFKSYGKHVINIKAFDCFGTVSNDNKIEYFSAGKKAEFSEPVLKGGSDAGIFEFGKAVNPEGNSVFEIEASALCGIKSASYSIEWTADKFGRTDDERREEKIMEIKNPVQKIAFAVPVEILPWGFVWLNFKVTDVYERESVYSTCVNVKNLTKVLTVPSENLVEEINDENAAVKIADVAGSAYRRGMNVYVPSASKSPNARWNRGKNLSEKKAPVGINLEVTSELKDLTLSYKIYSSVNAGENFVSEGKASVVRTDKNSPNGTAYIPLEAVPPGMTTVEITALSGKEYSAVCYAQIAVIRQIEESQINDVKAAQYFCTEDTVWDSESGSFIIGNCKKLCGIANLEGKLSASFAGRVSGLEVSVSGKTVSIVPLESGIYKDVVVRVENDSGEKIDFAPVTFIYDVEAPAISVQRPALYEWVRDKFVILGTVTDKTGILSVEYSVDGEKTWKSFGNAGKKLSMQIMAEEDIAQFEDGIFCVDIKAVDITGNVSYYRNVLQKDTNPPAVTVIVPGIEETINGKNAIAFIAKDEGFLDKVEYVNINTGVRTEIPKSSMITTFVGTSEMPVSKSMRFDFKDIAGNVTSRNSWEFIIDSQSDLPVATVQLPTENEVVTKDFVISGVVLDDDGASSVFYKIDNGKYLEIPGQGYSFSVDIPLESMTDNEHSVTVYGVDINGVKGPEFVRKFRVSLEEPVGRMTAPLIESTQSKIVTLTGTASDKNGIAKVEVSVDNGNSYNDAVGKENWTYTFDTRVLPDETHVVFIRTTDEYGIESIYSSLINIDNTCPELSLELPLDDSKTTGPVFFSGFTLDNIGLTELYITVTSLDGKYVSPKLSRTDLVPDKIITTTVDLSTLDNGRYNVQLTGKDAAGNESSVSRNITLDKRVAEADVNIYYPLNGEHKDGEFNIYGEVITTRKVNSVTLVVDGKNLETAVLSETGYFKFPMSEKNLTAGNHTYKVRASLEGNMSVDSIEQTVSFNPYGAWITIDNFDYGDFAIERPYIKGRAGYTVLPEELEAAKAKGATKEQKAALEAKSLSYIELSFDNGKTFKRIGNNKNWKYRIENEDMKEGYHFMLLRAVMKNGESAINRCIVQIDKTAPFVKMIAPGIGGRYNQSLEFSGLASDAVGLNSVTLSLRKGDKAGYEVPGFIQGLYLDGSFWGASLFNVGLGLSFFDDNVKLQFQYGQFSQEQREMFSQTRLRYGGNVFGLKLLANIAYIPFRWMFGPDWDWLSMGVALGANFSMFTETASGKPQMLSALLGQVEFPRVTFKKSKCFRTISLYSEFQLWFIPSDVTGGNIDIKNMVFQFSEGIRINIF